MAVDDAFNEQAEIWRRGWHSCLSVPSFTLGEDARTDISIPISGKRFHKTVFLRFRLPFRLKKVCRRLGILFHVWASTFGRVGVLRCRLAPAREAWPHVTHRALLPLSERVKEGSQNAPPPEEVAHRLPEEDRTRLSQSLSDVRSRRHRVVQPHLKRRPIHPSSIVSAQRRSRSAKGQIKLIGSAIFFRARCQYLRWRRR